MSAMPVVSAVWVSGVTAEGERFYTSAMELPIRVAAPFPDKESLERAQLEKYRLDWLLKHGRVPFEDVRRGGLRPDFILTSPDTTTALDCAALALEERRRAEDLFERLHERIAKHGATALRNLAECDVFLWFGRGDGHPPRRSDESLDEEIADALASVTVDRVGIARLSRSIAENGFPASFPQDVKLPIEQRGQFGFSVTPIPGWKPRSEISAELGFNLILRLQVTVRSIREELERVVRKHDNAETEVLLLTVGGPDRNGLRFPSESNIGQALKEADHTPLSVRHLQAVLAHMWEGGDVLALPVQHALG